MVAGKQTRGFTLTELVIGVAIVAILSVLAMPSFITQIKRDRLVTQANQIQALYRFARSEAVKRDVALELRASDKDWRVIEMINGEEIELRRVSIAHATISIAFPSLQIRQSGEVSQASNVLITDNDVSTTDIRFCTLLSGQSWLAEGQNACA
ncbi:GspH/FimT family pseudopilin [Pseudoalteromonas xiamenensis]|uniref:GspH/FimT family pseudopilin n=1 Tax=Pseudoalteromonas xiamenensis TaxID=882626 RepID=UPI0035E973A0